MKKDINILTVITWALLIASLYFVLNRQQQMNENLINYHEYNKAKLDSLSGKIQGVDKRLDSLKAIEIHYNVTQKKYEKNTTKLDTFHLNFRELLRAARNN